MKRKGLTNDSQRVYTTTCVNQGLEVFLSVKNEYYLLDLELVIKLKKQKKKTKHSSISVLHEKKEIYILFPQALSVSIFL